MDGFNNMGEDNSIKADINVVDAPTAQNVVVEAPSAADDPFAPTTEPVTEILQSTTEAPAEPEGFKVQSQEDYFASAFSYGGGQQDAGSTDAFGTGNDAGFGTSNGSAGAGTYGTAGAYSAGGTYGTSLQGNGNYGAGGNYGGTADSYGAGGNAYGTQNGYTGAGGYGNANTYGGADTYGSSNTYGGTNTYGGSTGGGYGYAQGYGNNTQYGTPGYAQTGYPSNQEFSTPDYYGNNVYANDPFASYYDDDFPERKSNGKAVAALVCGIASVALTCSGIGIVPGIVAIILGIQGSKECEKARMASIGMILGIVGGLINLIRLGAFILQLTTSIMDYI